MARINVVILGTGLIARKHMGEMLKRPRITRIQALIEVSEKSREITADWFTQEGKKCPPFYSTLQECLAKEPKPDAALIATPHKFHFEQARDCLKAGLDVMVEKPMVMNESEARRLIRVRNQTGRLLVVGFNGSLSDAIAKTKKLIAKGKIGRVTGITAHVHQGWKESQKGAWRVKPEISGGGFLFDTGSHMLNTVVDLAGSDVAEVFAILDYSGTAVEINSAVCGRFKNGVIFSLAGFGDSIYCNSFIRIIGSKGVLETGIWGECLLFLPDGASEYEPLVFTPRGSTWNQFVKVFRGKMENPCPAETGLRLARLMDMIRESAADGKLVRRKK